MVLLKFLADAGVDVSLSSENFAHRSGSVNINNTGNSDNGLTGAWRESDNVQLMQLVKDATG